ncbi:hypothetical protein MU796_14885, partial [Salmonella enterica subsp. enterica serovar Enteritidis]|nr:hypothetical protein [Salmonella enterica subsp. enterica serovar Enteritidis]
MIKRTLLLAMLPILAHAEELPAPVKAIEKQGITILNAKWHLNRSQFGIRIDHDLASISDHSLASQSITIWHAS